MRINALAPCHRRAANPRCPAPSDRGMQSRARYAEVRTAAKVASDSGSDYPVN